MQWAVNCGNDNAPQTPAILDPQSMLATSSEISFH